MNKIVQVTVTTVAMLAGYGAAAAWAATEPFAPHVPRVTGDTAARAEHVLAGEGYEWKTDPAKPHGAHWYVAAEKPGAGAAEPQGTVITLTLRRHSTGTAEVAVPDVRGDKYNDAKQYLAQYGLTARRGAPGDFTVRREHPRQGSAVARGSTVTLYP